MSLGAADDRSGDPNLYLVTTYAPLFALLFRACLLLMSWDVMRQLVFDHALLCAVLASVVYLDAMLWHGTYERGSGCLLVFALALQTHTPPIQACSELHDTMHWASDLLWAALSMLQVAGTVLKINLHLPTHTFKIGVCAAFFVAHTWLACSVFPTSEWLWRMVCYFFACAIVFFGSRARHLAPHACMHFLFVHPFVLVASFAILLALHGWLFYVAVYVAAQAADSRQKTTAPRPAKRFAPEENRQAERDCEAPDAPAHDDLLLKLRAAKAAAHTSR